MHHHRQRQQRLERVLGDQRDLAQVRIEVRTAGARLPHQHEVGRRHELDLAGVGVERVLAGHQRVAPDALAAGLHQLAMRVVGARHVVALAARVRHHHADEADRDHRLVDQLDRREQAVDVVRAFHQHALLAAALAAVLQELLGFLERVVMVADVRREQLVARQGGAVLHRHHGQQVGRMRVFRALDHQRRESATQVQQLAHLLVILALGGIHRHRVRGFLRHHHEQRRVDDVRAFAQDLALRALLAAAFEERADVEEVVDRRVVGQRLARGQIHAVTREHVADLALRHRHHRADVNAVLQRLEEVEAAAPQLGLEAGLAMQRQQAQLHGAAAAP